jgi:hypothetical protein
VDDVPCRLDRFPKQLKELQNGSLTTAQGFLDPAQGWQEALAGGAMPDDPGIDGTAALTYHRYRTLDETISGTAVVDRDEIRQQFRAVRFQAPVPMARTLWQAIYDLDEPGVEVSFYLRDEGGVSCYTDSWPTSLLPLGTE